MTKRILPLFLLSAFPLFSQTPYVVNVANDTHTSTDGTFTVGSPSSGDLRGVLNAINTTGTAGSYMITFDLSSGNEEIQLQTMLPVINLFATNTVVIQGNNSAGSGTAITIDGTASGAPDVPTRGFFARQGTVTLENMTIQNCKALGGSGGADAGGGGLGAGGGLFIDQANVTVTNVTFTNCTAVGGAGAAATFGGPAGGGGGMGGWGGAGGANSTALGGCGGGGGMGSGISGGSGQGGAGGAASGSNAGGGGGGGGLLGKGGAGGAATASDTPGAGGGGGVGVNASGGSGASGGTAPNINGGSGSTINGVAIGGGGGGSGGTGVSTGGAGGGAGCSASGTSGGGGAAGFSGAGCTNVTGGKGGGGAAAGNAGQGGIGGGGGGSVAGNAQVGGYGGGGGGGEYFGNGGFGGGGAAAFGDQTGGTSSFGGGGGSGSSADSEGGGDGGFGGGGGGFLLDWFPGTGGVGGGDYPPVTTSPTGLPVGGGGGAGMGGAIFVNDGGTLTWQNSSTSGSATTGGAGATSEGDGFGTGATLDLFAITGATINLAPPTGMGLTISAAIGDDSVHTIPSGETWTPGSGSGLVIKQTGAGTTYFTSTTVPNTYSGGTNISAGSINFHNGGKSFGSGTITFTGSGTLQAGATSTNNLPQVTIDSSQTATIDTQTFNLTTNGAITGSGNLTKMGSGILSLTGTSNNYSGTTTVNVGTLQAGVASAFSSSSAVAMADAAGTTLDLSSHSNSISTLSGGGTTGGNVTLGSGTLTLTGASSATSPYAGAITGTNGNLTLSGSGTFQLSGTSNTYNGTTTINSGALQSGMAGSFSPNSAVVLANTAGVTLDLNGHSNSITTISGGGSTGGNITSSSGSAVLTLTGVQSAGSPVAGQVTGAVGFLLGGSGTFQLSGTANNYTGTTQVDSGAFQAGAVGSFSSGSAVVLADSAGVTLDLNNKSNSIATLSGGGTTGGNVTLGSGTLTLAGVSSSGTPYAGAITGSGGLTLSGSGTFALTGTGNNYNGTTTINSGSLQAQAPSSFSPNTAVVLANASGATLDLNGQDNSIVSLSGGGSTGGNVNLNAATLTITGSATETFAGAIGGSGGGLTLSGSGITTLTGTNTYTGATMVSGGTLIVGVSSVGSLTSPVTVQNGAFLKGSGTISALVTIENGGTISGGNSLGTIHLGSLTLSSGANLALEINASGQNTLYQVTGDVILGSQTANLLITADFGSYRSGQVFTFITTTTGTVSGTFIAPTLPPLITGAHLTYGTDFVELVLESVAATSIPTSGLKGNAAALANYLNRFGDNPLLQQILVTIANLPLSQMQAALNSISPARNAISTWTAQNTMFGVENLVVNRLLQQRYMRAIAQKNPAFASLFRFEEDKLVAAAEPLKPAKFAEEGLEAQNASPPHGKTQNIARKKLNRFAVWVDGQAEFTYQGKQSENPYFRSTTGSALAGVDWYGFQNGQIGGAAGYAKSRIQQGNNAGSGLIDNYIAGVYGTAYIDDGYIELGLWGAYTRFHNRRHISYTGFSGNAYSKHNGWQGIPHIGVGYDCNFDWGALEPFVSFDPGVIYQTQYSEHGGGVLDMHVPSSTSWLLRSEGGLNAYQVTHYPLGYMILRETLSYVNLHPMGTGVLGSNSLVGFPTGFTVSSFTQTQNLVSPGFELFFKLEDSGFFISLIYDGEFQIGGAHYVSNEGIVKFGGFF